MRNFSRKSSPSLSVSRPSNPSSNSELTEAYFKDTVFGCINVFPGTNKHRRIHQIQMICFPFIPILALFIQNFIGTSHMRYMYVYISCKSYDRRNHFTVSFLSFLSLIL